MRLRAIAAVACLSLLAAAQSQEPPKKLDQRTLEALGDVANALGQYAGLVASCDYFLPGTWDTLLAELRQLKLLWTPELERETLETGKDIESQYKDAVADGRLTVKDLRDMCENDAIEYRRKFQEKVEAFNFIAN